MILAVIFLAIVIVGLVVYLMLDGWISFTAVFLCSFTAISAVYGDINFALFVMAIICSIITMAIIGAVLEIIKSLKRR